jgi:hypothetical protein
MTEKKHKAGVSDLQQIRKEVTEAWDELLSELLRFERDARLMQRLQALQSALSSLIGDEDVSEGQEEDGSLAQTGQQRAAAKRDRGSAGMHELRKQTGRHDKWKDPRGFEMRGGALWFKDEVPPEEVVQMADDLRVNLTDMLGNPPKLERAAKEIAGAHAAFFPGLDLPDWARALDGILQYDAVHRESRRLLAERKESPPPADEPEWEVGCAYLFRPVSGEEILSHLQRFHEVPVEVTPERLEELRGRVGLNSGGPGGKKVARSAIREFLKTLRA